MQIFFFKSKLKAFLKGKIKCKLVTTPDNTEVIPAQHVQEGQGLCSWTCQVLRELQPLPLGGHKKAQK